MKPILISLCMIVKNEEDMLQRCLESVQGLADEIIIVDTGSTDRTKEIAKQFTKNVFDFTWVNDFAAARNESIRHARGEWILILDADEFVQKDKHAELKHFLKNFSEPGNQCFLLQIYNFMGEGNSQISQSTAARLFRNYQGIHYRHPLHEQLVTDTEEIVLREMPFIIYHSGYLESVMTNKGKSGRNLTILNKMKSEDNRSDPYFFFILGNEYLSLNRIEEAADMYTASFEQTKSTDSWLPYLLERYIKTLIQLSQWDKVIPLVDEGIRLWPERTDFYCLKGLIQERFFMLFEAKASFDRCLEIAEAAIGQNKPYSLLNTGYGTSIPHRMLAEIHRKLGDLHAYIAHMTKYLQFDKNDAESLFTLMQMLSIHIQPQEILRLIQTIYQEQDKKHMHLLLQTAINTGSTELTQLFWNECDRLHIPRSETDRLWFHLIHRLEKPEFAAFKNQSVTPQLALLAAVIFDNPALFDTLSSTKPDGSERLLHQVFSALSGQSEPLTELNDVSQNMLVTLILQLFKLRYSDLYNSLLGSLNPSVLSDLADSLMELGFSMEALELYSALVEYGYTPNKGCKSLAQWFLLQQAWEEGFELLNIAMKHGPDPACFGIAHTFGRSSGSGHYDSLAKEIMTAFPYIDSLK